NESVNGQGLGAGNAPSGTNGSNYSSGHNSHAPTPNHEPHATAAAFDRSPRRVYDVRPRTPIWGWAVVSYIWTKSIAAGGFLAAVAARFALGPENSTSLQIVLGTVAIFFLVVTGVLLVVDLKQPKRFLYVLLRPQWQSWLVR